MWRVVRPGTAIGGDVSVRHVSGRATAPEQRLVAILAQGRDRRVYFVLASLKFLVHLLALQGVDS